MSTNLSNYNIYVYKGNNFSIEVKYTDNLNIGIDLSNYTANMSIRRSRYDNELLTQVNENYPNGVINGGLSGDYEDGSGFSGLTGGLQLNYNGITGNIKIEIDPATTGIFPVGKHSYDMQLVDNSNGNQKTILRGIFEVLPSVTKKPNSLPEFVGDPSLNVEIIEGEDPGTSGPNETPFEGSAAWGTDELGGTPEPEVQQASYFYVNSDVSGADGITYQYYIDTSVDSGELTYFKDLKYSIHHDNVYKSSNLDPSGTIPTEQTDEYVWRIGSSITFETGTFLDGTPWVVDNGDVNLISVSPTEQVIDVDLGTGIVGRTVVNPDHGKLVTPDFVSGVTVAAQYKKLYEFAASCRTSEAITAPATIPYDFRAGVRRGTLEKALETVGSMYDSTQAWDGTPIKIEAGDMIITQTPFTGGSIPGSSDLYHNQSYTESWGGFSVVSSTPPENSFRPPVNWDPLDKANRPIFQENDNFSDDIVTYPNYSISSDDPVIWEGPISYDERIENRLGSFAMAFHFGGLSGFRGSAFSNASSRDEYGGVPGVDEEKMMMSCFDPGVSGETRDNFRRIITQRGIDQYGSLKSLGKSIAMDGGVVMPYMDRVYFAWAVTNSDDIKNVLDGVIGNTGNSTYSVFNTGTAEGFGYEESHPEIVEAQYRMELCSWRHFDLDVENTGMSGGVRWLDLKRPKDVEEYKLNSEAGNPPIYNFNRVRSARGGGWGTHDNQDVVIAEQLIGAFVRAKVNEVSLGITRVVNAERINGDGDKFSPDFIRVYIQDDLVTDDTAEIKVDINGYLDENLKDYLPITILSASSTSSIIGSQYAYGYSMLSNVLPNYLVSKAKGGRSNIPFFGQVLWDRAKHLLGTMDGKQCFLAEKNATYNINSDLYNALARQEIVDGLTLAETPFEKGDVTDPNNWYSLPETKTWPEVEYPPYPIVYWSGRPSSKDGAPIPTYKWSDNSVAFTWKKKHAWWDEEKAAYIMELWTDNLNGAVRWGDIKNLTPYIWYSGIPRPIELVNYYTSAESDDDTAWKARYEILDSNQTRVSYGRGTAKSSLIFADKRSEFNVTVGVSGGSNVYFINGVAQDTLTLFRNIQYTFSQADSSNTGHPIAISETENGTHNGGVAYTDGWSSLGSISTLFVSSSTPSTLYYYCQNHPNMGGEIRIAESRTSSGSKFTLSTDLSSSDVTLGSSVEDSSDSVSDSSSSSSSSSSGGGYGY